MVRSWIGSKKTVGEINVKLEWNETNDLIDPKKKREIVYRQYRYLCTGIVQTGVPDRL
jgi:hypothetical protein